MPHHPRSTPPDDTPERRASPRIPAAAVPYLTAHVAGGPPVRLLDLCKRGVQLETTVHMRPGCSVGIRFLAGDASLTLTAAVVRSTVAVFESDGGVTYHTALAFNAELSLCDEEFPAAASEPPVPCRSAAAPPTDYTMIVMDGRRSRAIRTGDEPAYL